MNVPALAITIVSALIAIVAVAVFLATSVPCRYHTVLPIQGGIAQPEACR